MLRLLALAQQPRVRDHRTITLHVRVQQYRDREPPRTTMLGPRLPGPALRKMHLRSEAKWPRGPELPKTILELDVLARRKIMRRTTGRFRVRHRLDRNSRRRNLSNSSGEIRRTSGPSRRVRKARAPCRKSRRVRKAGRKPLLHKSSVSQRRLITDASPHRRPTTGAK
jgi:hypothetical protein